MFIKEILIESNKYPNLLICCDLCNYKSNRKSNFDRHMKSMHEDCQHFQCCGQVFVNKASLKSHSKEYHKNGYRCDEELCNKVFPRKALLRRHQTVHNGIKEFSCPQCMYETSHKSNLERHCSRVHSLIVANPRSRSHKQTNTCKADANTFIAFNPNTIDPQNSLQSSSQSSSSSETELCSSQELVSNVDTSRSALMSDLTPIKSIAKDTFDDECLELNILDKIQLKAEDLNCDNKKLRLCLRPYKCLICWLLFESQLEYFEHQLLTDHMIVDSEQLEVIQAAAVLTQFSRSNSKSFSNI